MEPAGALALIGVVRSIFQNVNEIMECVRRIDDEDNELGVFRQGMIEMRDYTRSVEALLENPNSPLSRGSASMYVILLVVPQIDFLK